MNLKFDWDKRKGQAVVSGDLFDQVREYFSVHNDAARFARMRGRFCPSRTYVITPAGRFDIGLYYEIRNYLSDNQFNPELGHTDEFLNILLNSRLAENDVQIKPLEYELRDYQHQTVMKCLCNGRGVVTLATGGGKTLIMASVLENLLDPNFKCILIVPDLGLVEQTYKSFEEYGVGFTFSKWTGNNELDLSTNVVITNLGILQSSNSDTDWVHHVDVLMIDEVHKLRRGNKINKIIKKIHTPNKFGFTGTMPENLLDQWNIIGKIGPVIYNKSSYELRKQKFISNVKVQILDLEYNDKPEPAKTNNPTEGYRNELQFIASNSFRNDILTTLCNNFDNNALILIDYLAHGETLYDILKSKCKNKKVYYIRGEVEIADREKVKQLIEERTDVIVVAISKIFSTGIDIKNLHYIIFASGGKAKIKTVQSIGRGLRLHKDKKELIIFDIADRLKYGAQHVMKRKEFYKTESIAYGTQTITEKSSKEKSSQEKSTEEKE